MEFNSKEGGKVMRSRLFITSSLAVFLGQMVAVPTLRAEPTVISVPWDSSGDHTAKIEQAFEDAKAAGPDCIVELGPGTFIINRPIQVADFDGTFKGSGKAVTVVQNKYVEGEVFPAPRFPILAFPTLFAFYSTTNVERGGSADKRANLTISDMTLKELGLPQKFKYHEDSGYLSQFNDFVVVYGRNVAGTNEGTPAFVNVTFRSIDVIGEVNPSYQLGYNAGYGLTVKGWFKKISRWIPEKRGWLLKPETFDPKPISGNFTWVDCSFENMECPIAVYGSNNAAVGIEGIAARNIFYWGLHVWGATSSEMSPTTFDISNVDVENLHGLLGYDLGCHALAFWDSSALDVNISNMHATNISGLYIWNPNFAAPSTYKLENSVIQKRAGSKFAGVELWDELGAAGLPTVNFIASGNTFQSEGSEEPFGPIFSFGVDGAVVEHNTFVGFGEAAINVEPESNGNNWIISGNNVRGFIPRTKGQVFPAGGNVYDVYTVWGHIYLGRGTSNIMVVGGDSQDVVVDWGNANTVINARHRLVWWPF